MAIQQMKAKWRAYSGVQKAAIAGGALIVAAFASGGGAHQHGTAGAIPSYRGGGFDGAATQPAPMPGYGAMTGYAGAAVPSARDGGSDITAAYEAREKIQAGAARGFDQYIRDQTDVRDVQTGDIATDVPNDVATPEIASGSYAEATPAEVSTATDAAE